MTHMVYQARAGDGYKEKGLKRTDSYFNTPEEAVSEALALKEVMDSKYKHKIEWDYNKEITGSSKKMKILKGYLSSEKKSKAFYLQIISVKIQEGYNVVKPKKPKKISRLDKKMLNTITTLFA